ncbi:hypothetical protein [Pseudoxanthomonas mexicana]|uniref:hypothetical protein n=1 Tax=Pseudoxanthomonas mexicana TaxID=128785 RepID=UPI000B02F4E4|nr:hypothetical protein [Pseudoxanthomonas mexicana]
MSRVLIYPIGSLWMVRVIDNHGNSEQFSGGESQNEAKQHAADYFAQIGNAMPNVEYLNSKPQADIEATKVNGIVSVTAKANMRSKRLERLTSLLGDYADPTMTPRDLGDIWQEVEGELEAIKALK